VRAAYVIPHAPDCRPRLLEVTEHKPPMRDLPFIQASEVGLLTEMYDRLATEDVGIAHQPRPGAIHLAAVALEAEHVVSISAHFLAISESGLTVG
jgi:hypothetical protein